MLCHTHASSGFVLAVCLNAGGEQAEQVVSLLQQMSMAFEHVRKVKDLAGMDCFVTAFSRSNNQGTHH